ncbi:Zinc finger BED domain-containing protein 4 [Labeo rohita]|uniref:Zinc finger BED domain-containing protein 4 n=1 Tax=Labeo rohita TaxID=84645 RepID=A0ABQ8M9T2_LABRO|nr:Zinc finger BED domain-containing protein 4 [Labeo rohita]
MVKAFTLFPPIQVAESEEEEQDDTSDFEVVNVEEEMVYFPPERSSCFVHTLQLVVRDAMDEAGSIKNLLGKVQKLVSFCHKSTLATDALEGGHKLQPANATRWNSQLKMLRSVLNVPSDVLAEVHCPIQLTSYELKIIQELCEVLEPFEEATDRCQAEKIVTSSLIIPCVRGLRHAIKNMKMTGNKKFVSTLQSSLESRLTKFEEMECFQVAATLNPRFKLDWCIGEEQVIIKNLLNAKVESASPKGNATMNGSTQPKKRPKLFSYMESQSSAMPADTAPHEVPVYFSTPCLTEDTDPFVYWKENQSRFPTLAQLACKYLAIPASSAPVERIFSVAGKIFRPERCRLNDKTFEELLRIRCNSVAQ